MENINPILHGCPSDTAFLCLNAHRKSGDGQSIKLSFAGGGLVASPSFATLSTSCLMNYINIMTYDFFLRLFIGKLQQIK